jgi:hypothetical protein
MPPSSRTSAPPTRASGTQPNTRGACDPHAKSLDV